jgi:hypothetical protein
MARRRCTVTKRDVAALLKAARDAGLPVARIEVQDGKLTLVIGEAAKAETANEWDDDDADQA